MDGLTTKLANFTFSGMIVHAVFALAVILLVFMFMVPWLHNVITTPANPAWFNQYDDMQGKRQSLRAYLGSIGKSPDSVMTTQLQIATANYGGIFTETKAANMAWLTPWHGTVSSEAARLQVEAGARAMIFDIWPDPSDFSRPVVVAMVDLDESSSDSWWKNNGLTEGVGRYSNWKNLTRNKGAAGDIIKAAINAAFRGVQAEDPFFVILNLHGKLPPSYLNTLGAILLDALQGKKLSAPNINLNDNVFCSMPVSAIFDKAIVLVNPDVPSSMTRETFNAMYLNTAMKEVTNVLTTTERPLLFKTTDLSSITSAKYTDCTGSVNKVPLPAVALCAIQPTIGGLYTDNDSQFKKASLNSCMSTGAQFVGVNLFGSKGGAKDDTLNAWLDPGLFGVRSFKTG